MGGIRRVAEIASFHAHVYFDPEAQRSDALAIREAAGERFPVRLGTVRDRPVGPHSKAMYQIAFAPELFATLVPWLMLNRMGLSILVHPNTRRPRDDHLTHALWLGEKLPLKEEDLPVTVPEAEIEKLPPVNTKPTMQP
jgi:DOPA 4,5-dioxygenase